jgi:hypothetical protein
MLKLLRVFALAVFAASVLALPASAIPVQSPYSGLYYGNAAHSPNFTWESSLVAPESWIQSPNNTSPTSDGQYMSDMAFQGNLAIDASYNQFRVLDISDPTNPKMLPGEDPQGIKCLGGQGDMIVYGNLLFRANESARQIPNGDLTRPCDTPQPGESSVAFVGLTIFDFSNPAKPKPIIGVPACSGAHTMTKYYDDIQNKLYIIMTRGSAGTSNPQWGLDCSAAAVPSSRVDLIEVPLDHPEQAHLAGWLPTGGTPGTNSGCHDVNTYEELHLVGLACPSGNMATLLDVTDINNPVIKWTFTYPGISTMHTAGFTYSGKYVLVDAEPGGGSNAECDYNDDPVKFTLFIINRFNGQLVGQFHLPHPQATALVPPEGGVVEPTYCTLHELNTAPFIDRDIVASSCYNCGQNIIDITNPRAPRELGFWDPPEYPGAYTGLATKNGAGCWTGYWYNDSLYCNELDYGLHIWTVNEPWWKQSITLDEQNPQTITKRMRCSVSYTGGPTRAKKAGTVNVKVNVFGPAHLQPAWGAKVNVQAPGFYKTILTGENGTASVSVKAAHSGKLSVTVPNHENMLGCSAPSKSIKRPIAK